MANEERILAQLKNEEGKNLGAPIDLPLDVTAEGLQTICNALQENEEALPYAFFIHSFELTGCLRETLDDQSTGYSTEKVLEIVCQPQAVFKVRAVTRCTSSLPGHTEAVIAVSFSPDGRQLASGSGDTTVRFWDIYTETPLHTCKGHSHWILCISWASDGSKLASGCKNSQICIWDPSTGKQLGKTLLGHKLWITCLTWAPRHSDPECRYLASASKDCTVRIWDVFVGLCVRSLSGHTQSVTCVKWGGEGLLYTSSQDRTIRVWRAEDGILCRSLQGHGHWVNTLALSTDYAIRTGLFNPAHSSVVPQGTANELASMAKERYLSAKGSKAEMLVSGSDDFTMFLWNPSESKKPVAQMTGHQQLINQVLYSPDGLIIASASFDKSVKLWNGYTGKFIAALRGHVQAVYQIAWSADSRLLCSGSADSTLKVWNIAQRKLLIDLPGHADEVFSVDWSPDGSRVASGGRDRVLKLWRH
ncbi:notchless protein homolog 1-like [Corticium candelabrum]|uniref:notchless protein homolog 1-like n=1 Tax=Corticium candelabrum TaxID=121492 RepID=UPI002E269AA7|nr:notchless protein homolog 1-like [Corticium candelabrum]